MKVNEASSMGSRRETRRLNTSESSQSSQSSQFSESSQSSQSSPVSSEQNFRSSVANIIVGGFNIQSFKVYVW